MSEGEKYIVIDTNCDDTLHHRTCVHVHAIDQNSTDHRSKLFYSKENLRLGDIVVKQDDNKPDMCKKIQYGTSAHPATVLGTYPHDNGKTVFAFSAALGDIKIELHPSSPYLYTESGHEILVGYNTSNKMFYIMANKTANEMRRQAIKKYHRRSI